nr:8836_t:CDS:2 [Entrophospora candida]
MDMWRNVSKHIQCKAHVGIACNCCDKKEWKRARYNCSISQLALSMLPTTEKEMWKFLREEEKRKLSQQQYYKVGSDPTSGKD